MSAIQPFDLSRVVEDMGGLKAQVKTLQLEVQAAKTEHEELNLCSVPHTSETLAVAGGIRPDQHC